MKVFVNGYIGTPDEYDRLIHTGLEVSFGRPLKECLARPDTEDELADRCRDVDAFIYSVADTVSRPVMTAAPHLRIVTSPTIGYDTVDVAAATDLGIMVANSPSDENARGIAEATIGLILVLLKRARHNEAKLRAGEWSGRDDRGELLWGKTLGIVGLGRIAREVVSRLQGWGVRIVAHDPYVSEAEAAGLGVIPVDLEELCRESDVVSLHAVATRETAGIIGERQLGWMKPDAYLVNLARGELVDEAALAHALEAGRIGGAALDTYQREPLPLDSPLRRVADERLILTPHIVGQTEIGRRANLRVCLENVQEALRGDVPHNVVNPEVIPRWTASLASGSGG